MLTRFIIIAMFLHTAPITSGQTILKRLLSKQQAANLLRSLNKNVDDTTRIDILLKLADYHLQKEEGGKPGMDTAETFISQAKVINSRQRFRSRDGIVSLYGSSLLIKRGEIDAARKLLGRAIGQLQTSNDEYHLLVAYLELSRCYGPEKPEQETAIKNVFTALFQRVPGRIRPNQVDTCMLELINFYNLRLTNDSHVIKLDFLDHLVRAYRLLARRTDEFWTRKEMADIHFQQGNINQAIKELLEIAKEQKSGGYAGICYTYDLLSGLYYASGNLDKALYYSLQTIKSVHTADDSFYLSNFYARVAGNYSQTGSAAEAVNWNLKRLNYDIQVRQTNNIYNTISNLTSDLLRLQKPKEALGLILDKSRTIAPEGDEEKVYMLLSLAQCHAAVNKKAAAEKYCEELIAIVEPLVKKKGFPGDMEVYEFLASFYLSAREFNKAEKYFKAALRVVPANIVGDLYKSSFLFYLDSAKGNYLSAIKHLQALQKENDSIFTVKKTQQIEELKIAYETERKDQLLNLKEQNIQLLTKQDQLQKSRLHQGAILRNISYAVVTLLIVIVALLFNRYRLKQRTNRRLELQQLEIARQNVALHHLVNEKDWLVKEIHHRVKNNLQIVMSLLNSQSAFIDNDAALTAIHDSQHRVHAMSLIHQKLYNSENLSSIDMSIYIRELVSYLRDSFNIGQRIRFDLAIEPLEMDVSQAVPLGLILNEAITNAIKYALPDERDGIISISISAAAANQYLLTISDNGIGIPAHFFNKKRGSLGMSLMEGLSKELGGSFFIENNKGTTIRISFVYDIGVRRPETQFPDHNADLISPPSTRIAAPFVPEANGLTR